LFYQADAGIRGLHVTGVQTCALPIWLRVSRCRLSTSECARSITYRQQTLHVLRRLNGAHVDVGPVQDSDAAAMMASADFGEERRAGGQRDAQELVRRVAIEHNLEDTASRHFGPRTTRFAGEPQ